MNPELTHTFRQPVKTSWSPENVTNSDLKLHVPDDVTVMSLCAQLELWRRKHKRVISWR